MIPSSHLVLLRERLAVGPASLQMGIGGGGREFVTWLAAGLGLGARTGVERTASGLQWTFSHGRVVDGAAFPVSGDVCSSVGQVRVEHGHVDRDAPSPTVHADGIVSDYLLEILDGRHAAVEDYLARLGGATSLTDVPDWEAIVTRTQTAGHLRRMEGLARRAESYREHFRAIQGEGGSRLLDLGRVIYLLAPEPMHLGDEWASLASANSNRVYSLADINLVLSEFPDLFSLDSSSDVPTVEATNPFVRMLFSGFVPVSSSEYVEIFRWLSQRAITSLTRSDSSDFFIRTALPVVAARGGCLPTLLENGAVMLASDVTRLATYLERDPAMMVDPGAKAILLHAHRLGSGAPDREAEMEFALRRMSLTAEADRIAEALPERAWRPVWSSTSPTNVHRVLSEDSAGVLAIATVLGPGPFRAYAGLGNGKIRQLGPTQTTLLDTRESRGFAEIRGLAVGTIDGADVVVAASSDATIRAIRVADPDGVPTAMPAWQLNEPLGSPLTAAAAWTPADGRPVVLSGGVSGTVWAHDMATGEDVGALMSWGAEIRSIRVVQHDGRSLVVLAAVDGRIGIVDPEEKREVAVTTLVTPTSTHDSAPLTPSSMDAVTSGGRLHLIVGCALGEVFEGSWSSGEILDLAELKLPGVPPSGVNEVVLRLNPAEGLQRFVARNDGVWLRYDPDNARRVKAFVGHAGPVLSQAVLSLPGSDEVVALTGGSEGTVRMWRHVEEVEESLAYLRVNRHRGAIRSVEVRAEDSQLHVVTGGDDGDVRVWRGHHATRGSIVSQHQGRVSRFLWLKTPAGSQLVVGASDGTLRLASVDNGPAPARLLGIAHEGVTDLASSQSEGMFWSAGNDGSITRWDALAGVARGSQMVCQYGSVTAMTADSQGRLFVGGQDGTLSMVDPDGLQILATRRFDSAVVTLDVITGLDLLVVGLATGQLFTIEVDRGLGTGVRELHRHHLGAVAARAIELHGQIAVGAIGRDRKLVVIDVNSRAILHDIGLEGFPTDLSVSGPYIAVSTTAGVTLFEFADGHLSPRRVRENR